jgi:hypothetical protein
MAPSNGLAVTFDTYDNSTSDVAPTISIKFNGTTIAAVLMAESNPNADPAYVLPVPTDPASGSPMTLFTGDKFVSVQIELRNDGRMDVSYKNVKVLANVATGYTPRSGQFGFAARTGGSYAAHWIDDLSIVVNRDTAAGVPDFASSVATNLNSWIANTTFRWPDTAGRPRVVNAISVVGQRIAAPGGELGASADYLAGHINVSAGLLFNPQAYLDPFVGGFTLANAGAIIPVNDVRAPIRSKCGGSGPTPPVRA